VGVQRNEEKSELAKTHSSLPALVPPYQLPKTMMLAVTGVVAITHVINKADGICKTNHAARYLALVT